ncbi:NAD-dependent epimerase/dehydratase family protein [Brumimicrobium aurantiacum]|uniref:NAD-dependent epimerase/dehydratase family protein n=1 Tax=Brumimicrobium aurantiacum TaxID=1737063 RepID=A0A3E1F0Y0_9FLAO|nr:NAD-dependent epimerase/dehydratase family protein [Brumimicrobium aurantiacum]RFC55474.1 NAD-dependent epimerase/dehydratase family protein [Brumimicrobium aurantiacum]
MVFVTGGTGLLGSHLLVKLAQQHEKITAIYRNASKIKTVEKCFDYYLKSEGKEFFKRINWVACDVLNVPELSEIVKGHKIIYHCAAIVSFARRDFVHMMEINRYGTENMVNLALEFGVEKFCFVSSTAAVGNKDIPEEQEVDENGKWVLTDETSGYSVTKYSAEKEVWRGIEEGLNAVIVNPSVIFGAGDWSESSMKIFKTVSKGLQFYSPGANSFVDARDVANIMVELMNRNIFNQRYLCIGANSSFKNLFELISKHLGQKPPSKQVHPILMGITWRLSVFWAAITFSKPLITKSAANNAFNTIKYSNQKVKDELNYSFYSLEETVENAVKGRLD